MEIILLENIRNLGSIGEKVIVKKSPYNARFLRSEKPDFFYTALNMRLGLAYRSQRPPEDPEE